ncbi:hypothetical protein ARMGADRAFT_42256 [Armillaria gallica]|uniref:Uncharacterized protein n=1 Tax=Armillaria gallica TaxID=47427 RepID=A0A2H3E9J2_ARMGA|nr:hypothetical protein ARMGADRAFT_42256 [Armillaria gallica]
MLAGCHLVILPTSSSVQVLMVQRWTYDKRTVYMGLIAQTPRFKSKMLRIVGVSPDKSRRISLEIGRPAGHWVIGDEGQFEVDRST